jgi:hypothetical protein
MTRKQHEARQALRRAERLLLEVVMPDDREAVAAALTNIEAALTRAEPAPPIEVGTWVVRSLDTYDDTEIERTPRGKWICPLCGGSYWGKPSLARHMQSPHGVCPEVGCGTVVVASGLASHMWGRHERTPQTIA